MSSPSRMPRYDIRNDGVGPYAVFYCDKCDREFRSKPDLGRTAAQDLGRKAMGDALRTIPLFGRAVAQNVVGEDPRYSTSLTPQQLQSAWEQVEEYFHECPTCRLIVCPSDFDTQTGFCTEDSPRRGEIARAEAEQAAGVVKGLADAFGLGDALRNVSQAAKTTTANLAHCPKDGTPAPAGTKFCPECGSPMVQPAANTCPQCGAAVGEAKFCPACGTKIERAAPGVCGSCGAAIGGAKFCPECGAKVE
jgi:hypothetical protein